MSDHSDHVDAGRSNASEVQSEAAAISSVLITLSGLPEQSREKVLLSVAAFFGVGLAAPVSLPPVSLHRHAPEAPHSSAATPGSFSDDRTISPKEFMLQKKPMQDIERITCLAYYLTHYRDTPHFKTLDLSKLNTEAAQMKFSNAAKAVENATSAGLLVQATKGMKQISAKGELYVQALPDRTAAKEAVAHFRQRRKVRRARVGNTSPNGSVSEVDEDVSDE